MATHHYVFGAGFVGCLYDYGPEAYETLEDALQEAEWYLVGYDGCTDEDSAALEAEQALALANLREHGIHHFSAAVRRLVTTHYMEIQRVPGPCPEADD